MAKLINKKIKKLIQEPEAHDREPHYCEAGASIASSSLYLRWVLVRPAHEVGTRPPKRLAFAFRERGPRQREAAHEARRVRG